MTVFVIQKQYWDDNSDCRPFWRNESIMYNVDEPEEMVVAMVNSLNKEFSKEHIEELEMVISRKKKLYEQNNVKLEQSKNLTVEQREAFSIDVVSLQTKKETYETEIENLEISLKLYKDGRGELTKERYVYYPLQMHGITELSTGFTLVQKVKK